MSQAAAAATGGVLEVVDDTWPASTTAPARSGPDRPELAFPAQPLVISTAWWILIGIAVIQAIWD
jgi:hypothetical protein